MNSDNLSNSGANPEPEKNDLIDQYLDGLCSDEEMEEFERRCFTDNAFFDQVRERERFRELVAETSKEKAETIFAEFLHEEGEEKEPSWLERLRTTSKRFASSFSASLKQNWKAAYAVAALLLISVTSVLYLNLRDAPHEALFKTYFQPFTSTIPSPRGTPSGGLLEEGMTKYKAGDYQGALEIYEDILRTEPAQTVANFYAAISYLALNELSPAITSFQKVSADEDSQLQQPAEWYLALAYLKANDLPKVKSQLAQIVSRQGIYKEQASTLLQSLYE